MSARTGVAGAAPDAVRLAGAEAVERRRHFLSIADWSREALYDTLDRGHRLKAAHPRRAAAGDARGARGARGSGGARGGDQLHDRPLAGRTLAMLFAKSSTRTRVSFEVGMYELGGHALFLSARDIQLGRGEPIADTARVLSRYVDGIMIRTFAQSDAEELASHGSVPVINGLTDLLHPCQVMADLMTAQEEFGRDLSGLAVAWVGDGNNMANSWLNAAARFGFDLRLACPEGYDPDPDILRAAGAATTVRLVRRPEEAVAGASLVTTDVWASMGHEEEVERRRAAFADYHVDEDLMGTARSDAIFLHCLPAHRGEEVSAGVIDGPASRIWDEAENRLHVQKAILLRLLAPEAAGAAASEADMAGAEVAEAGAGGPDGTSPPEEDVDR